MAELDPNILETYADHLQRRANSLTTAFTIFGALLGSALGSAPLFSLKHGLIPQHLGYATLLCGMGAGGLVGYKLGLCRGEGRRLQAQVLLHQLQVERAYAQHAPVAPAPIAPVPVAAAPVAAAPVAAAPVAAVAVAPAARAPTVPVAPAFPLAPVFQPPAPPLSAAPEPVAVQQAPPAFAQPASVPTVQPVAPYAAPAPTPPAAPRLVEPAPAAPPPVMIPPLSVER
jgi:hypothetical protein